MLFIENFFFSHYYFLSKHEYIKGIIIENILSNTTYMHRDNEGITNK